MSFILASSCVVPDPKDIQHGVGAGTSFSFVMTP